MARRIVFFLTTLTRKRIYHIYDYDKWKFGLTDTCPSNTGAVLDSKRYDTHASNVQGEGLRDYLNSITGR